MRIGRRAIVSFPNFGHLADALAPAGQRPHADHAAASTSWYETPNIHFCTIRDFVALCDEIGVPIERSLTLDRHGRPYPLDPRGGLANLLAEQGLFVLCGSRGEPHDARR